MANDICKSMQDAFTNIIVKNLNRSLIMRLDFMNQPREKMIQELWNIFMTYPKQ